jgi:hypothetical protein
MNPHTHNVNTTTVMTSSGAEPETRNPNRQGREAKHTRGPAGAEGRSRARDFFGWETTEGLSGTARSTSGAM